MTPRVNQVTDELFMHQPFLLSLLMGYKLDLSATELNEALTLYMTIWEYFKASPEAKTRATTEIRFEHFQELNIKMLATMESAEF
jgi:hypothetical protein